MMSCNKGMAMYSKHMAVFFYWEDRIIKKTNGWNLQCVYEVGYHDDFHSLFIPPEFGSLRWGASRSLDIIHTLWLGGLHFSIARTLIGIFWEFEEAEVNHTDLARTCRSPHRHSSLGSILRSRAPSVTPKACCMTGLFACVYIWTLAMPRYALLPSLLFHLSCHFKGSSTSSYSHWSSWCSR